MGFRGLTNLASIFQSAGGGGHPPGAMYGDDIKIFICDIKYIEQNDIKITL